MIKKVLLTTVMMAASASMATAATISYEVNETVNSASIVGAFTLDTTAKTIEGFAFTTTADNGAVFDYSSNGATQKTYADTSLNLVGTTRTSGDYYLQSPSSSGVSTLGTNGSFLLGTEDTLIELTQYDGAQTTYTRSIGLSTPIDVTSPERRSWIVFSGSNLFSGASSVNLGFGFCTEVLGLFTIPANPFAGSGASDVVGYGSTDCGTISGTVSQVALIDFSATGGGVQPSAVPLPAGGLLLLSGVAGIAGLKRRKKRVA
ncbi:MAG: VPLPA-CTERM sorting domain-containing protein [Aliishimia sp.]